MAMTGTARVGTVLSLAAGLLLTACGTSSLPARSTPSASPPSGLMVFFVRHTASNPERATVELVDRRGHVAASADFVAPAAPFVAGSVAVTPPVVRVAAGAAFFADSAGVIRRLDADGTVTTVATFAITPDQFLSYAVSPDAKQLIAILVSTPPVIKPIPPFGTDPYVASGHWTLDLETAVAGGATTRVLHRDFGHLGPGRPTLIAGWDDAGPVATLNSYLSVQNVVPSLEYTGTQLVHLAMDGTHLDVIGGAGCSAMDELHDGTVLCVGGDWRSLSVRTRGGDVLWSLNVDGFVSEPRLSPDGSAVSLNGDQVGVYLRDAPAPASSARLSGVTSQVLGWFGSDQVVLLDSRGRLALAAVTDLHASIDLGLTPQPECNACIPQRVVLAGTLGI